MNPTPQSQRPDDDRRDDQDRVVQLLTAILTRVKDESLAPRPLTRETRAAIRQYELLLQTLDNETQRPRYQPNT